MASLRERIRSLRTKSTSRRYFIPDGKVEELISEDIIRDAVSNLGIDPVNIPEVNAVVNCGGKRTFAILVILSEEAAIWDLVKQDQFVASTLDAKLPWSYNSLEEIIAPRVAKDFVEHQWEFISPVFDRLKGHRLLHDDIILPYTSEFRFSEDEKGSFGDIYKTGIDARHLPLWSASQPGIVSIIRKQLPRKDVNFESEQRVLRYLNHMSHPCILQLLASYTLQNEHTLLFPLADMDLKCLLNQANAGNYFDSLQDYLRALAGLSSALELLHTYNSNELQVDLIGCHHDLKPSNIFVSRGRLVLADFGLSTLKSSASGSSEDYKKGADIYRAPECEDPDQGFKPGRVTRASDIWSFGCILAEVATYFANGPTSVEKFYEARERIMGGCFITRRFYASQKEDHPQVLKWLESLAASRTQLKQLTELIRHMLSINPMDRPKAHEVTMKLREMALLTILNSIDQVYSSLATQRSDPRLAIEHQRILLWGWAMGFRELDGSRNKFFEEYFCNLKLFETNFEIMSRLKDEVTLSEGERQCAPYEALQIRRITDELFESIPKKLQSSVQNLLELRILTKEDMDLFAGSTATLMDAPKYRNIGALTAIKKMSTLVADMSNGTSTNLVIDPGELRRIRDIGIHELAQYTPPNAKDPLPVLVEYKKINSSWTEERGSKLLTRVQNLVDLLHNELTSKTLRVLRCVGYRCEVRLLAFSLAFEYPECERNSSDTPDTFSLYEYLVETRAPDRYLERPSLNDRFQLAATLAESVMRIHKVGWLHKSIMPSNVIFFHSSTRPKAEVMKHPYLIGFSHSRPDDPQEFTETLSEDFDQTIYRHPAYASTKNRFRLPFDDYSLGLVLLEIGLWRPLRDMVKKVESLAPESMHKWILTEKVPQLSISMGAAYEDVVKSCLKDIVGTIPKDEDPSIHYASTFEDTILKPLRSCALATGSYPPG